MNLNGTNDDEAIIYCDVNAVPDAKIQWYMNGVAMDGKYRLYYECFIYIYIYIYMILSSQGHSWPSVGGHTFITGFNFHTHSMLGI